MLRFIKESRVLILLGISSIIFFCSFYAHYVHEPKKDIMFSIHTVHADLIHINLTDLSVGYEGSEERINFNSQEDLFQWIESTTAKGSIPSGYATDLQYHINNGYITAAVHADIDDNGNLTSPVGKIELIYDGPNWTNGSEQDTTYKVCKFPIIDTYDVGYDEFGDKTYPMFLGYGID